jgi:hypothetical protein
VEKSPETKPPPPTLILNAEDFLGAAVSWPNAAVPTVTAITMIAHTLFIENSFIKKIVLKNYIY